jgi:alpha-glucosidase (family GH31 glycosyl hydrolase)
VRASLALLAWLLVPACLFGQLGDYSSHEVTATGATVVAGADTLDFRFYASDAVRVDFLPFGARRSDTSYALVREPSSEVAFHATDGEDTLRVWTSDLEIIVTKHPVRISYLDAEGRELLAEPAAGGFTASGGLRRATFVLPPDLHFYGTGQRGIGIDLRGESFGTYNAATYGYSGPLETMSINIPFMATSSGYALYFESPLPATMDLGEADPQRFSYEISGGELAYFFMIGADVPGQIERYTWLTGRQPLPPKWALGYLQSKFGYRNRSEAEWVVHTLRSKGIPADALMLDLYWFQQMGDLAWNPSTFPDPEGMIGEFLDQGIKTIVITEPYFTRYCVNYPFLTGVRPDFVGRDSWGDPYLLGGWWSCGCDAVLLDITNPDAQAWLWGKYEGFMGAGVAGLWTDLGEPERHPWEMQHFIGATPEVHNIYSLLWAGTLFEGFSRFRPNDRIVNVTRSGYAGIQRYGVFTWSGDVSRSFGGLAVQLPIMLNMALSGMAYHSSDLGGFTGYASSELYTRWMQFGAFSPVMRPHGGDNQPTEPWGYGPDAEAIVRDYIRLRYRLLPYIYTLARETYDTGMPLVRPLFFSDPDDPALADRDGAYLFGPNILVAPVTGDGQRQRSVYLPAGYWVDYWTDALYQGQNTVIVSAPLERLPLFVRAGAIIPMQQVMDYVGAEDADTLVLEIFPTFEGVPETFTLYEDDGESLDYMQGEFARIPLSQVLTTVDRDAVLEVTVGGADGSFPGMVAGRTVLAGVHLAEGPPDQIYLDSAGLASYASRSDLLLAGDGYFYDAGKDLLLVKFECDVTVASNIRIEGLDLPPQIFEPDPEPGTIELNQNYPNPFAEETLIGFALGQADMVKLEIFNPLGQKVVTLLDGERPLGRYTVGWDGRAAGGEQCAPGIYVYRLSTGKGSRTRKVTLVR